MKPLPNTFSRDGYRCQVLKREGDVVLIRVFAGEHYEVAKIQRIKAKIFPDGRTIAPREALPSSENYGSQGWSFQSLSAGEANYDSVRAFGLPLHKLKELGLHTPPPRKSDFMGGGRGNGRQSRRSDVGRLAGKRGFGGVLA